MPRAKLTRENLCKIADLQYYCRDFAKYIHGKPQDEKSNIFNKFISLVTEQLSALNKLAETVNVLTNVPPNENDTEKANREIMLQKMNQEIAYMTSLFRAIINNVYMYNDHLKCGAQEAMESIQHRILGLNAMIADNKDQQNPSFTVSMQKANAALIAHNAAVEKGDELSAEDFKDAAFKMTMAKYGIFAIITLSIVIFGLASFGVIPGLAAGIAAGIGLSGFIGAGIIGVMYVEPEIQTNTFKQHEVESMESVFKNSNSNTPENSACHMSQLLDSDVTTEPPVSPVSDQSSALNKTYPTVDHTIQSDEQVVGDPTVPASQKSSEETQKPQSPTV